MKVYSQDIKEKREFTFQGDLLKYKKHEPTTNKYLYERYYKASNGEFRLLGYEVVIPVKHKNPDDSIVECYPSSEQFGSKGWFFPKSTTEDVLVMALKCEGNPFVKENAKK